MALIACAECGNHVSEKAASCPHCGNPIATASVAVATGDPTVVTTQETAKKFKGQQLLGGGLCGLAVIFLVSGEGSMIAIGTLLFIAGLALYFIARFQAWWHHG